MRSSPAPRPWPLRRLARARCPAAACPWTPRSRSALAGKERHAAWSHAFMAKPAQSEPGGQIVIKSSTPPRTPHGQTLMVNPPCDQRPAPSCHPRTGTAGETHLQSLTVCTPPAPKPPTTPRQLPSGRRVYSAQPPPPASQLPNTGRAALPPASPSASCGRHSQPRRSSSSTRSSVAWGSVNRLESSIQVACRGVQVRRQSR